MADEENPRNDATAGLSSEDIQKIADVVVAKLRSSVQNPVGTGSGTVSRRAEDPGSCSHTSICHNCHHQVAFTQSMSQPQEIGETVSPAYCDIGYHNLSVVARQSH